MAAAPRWADGGPAPKTLTGIELNQLWMENVYEFAAKNVIHPAWGLAHSERNYQVALEIAKREKVEIDTDVLFAASFLHDVGGLKKFEKPGVDHAVRSAELAQVWLKNWGFPQQKWPEVREMILGHTYYGSAPVSPSARAFRDADILDFLGEIGIARLFAITQEPDRASTTLKTSADLIKRFQKDLPGKLAFTTSKIVAVDRLAAQAAFLIRFESQTFGGIVP